MISLVASISAAGCAAFSNYIFKKSAITCANGYLVCFYFCAFLLSLGLNPTIFSQEMDMLILGLGSIVGVLNVFLMLVTSSALKRGSSGLTFAFQNASSVFPGLLLFLALGEEFNFSFNFYQFVGILFVLLGLFLGSFSNTKINKQWLFFAVSCLAIQIAALSVIQARCIFYDCPENHFLSSFTRSEGGDIWFMPGMFGSALMLQCILLFREKRSLIFSEIKYGFLGGLANTGSTCLLLMATKWALAHEKALLFPAFAVSTIIFCNLWAKIIYNEKFNFLSNAACLLGIVIGTFNFQ